ncbi:hypothetical protein MN116_002400 [Schistosoma mekongi]|uniref:Uncharacterized protein n=1 Tax=Schistosoma mekongi TaxID=38744 RepID=A0AAE1ZK41_SCHME|nr:hypothetical protein MN116_002400 [Schistosoma mekongi]
MNAYAIMFTVIENTKLNLIQSDRLIKRYDLNRLKVKIELNPNTPTLAERTHYSRLNRLVQVINENCQFYELLINQLKWLLTSIEDESDKMKFITERILNYTINHNNNEIPVVDNILQISKIILEICQSRKSHQPNMLKYKEDSENDINNKLNLINANISLEIFISELHVLIDYLLEYLCYFILNIRNNISLNKKFFHSSTLNSLTTSTELSNTTSSSSLSTVSTCSVTISNSISTLINNLLNIESHLPMKYDQHYIAAQKRFSSIISVKVPMTKKNINSLE